MYHLFFLIFIPLIWFTLLIHGWGSCIPCCWRFYFCMFVCVFGELGRWEKHCHSEVLVFWVLGHHNGWCNLISIANFVCSVVCCTAGSSWSRRRSWRTFRWWASLIVISICRNKVWLDETMRKIYKYSAAYRFKTVLSALFLLHHIIYKIVF